jgi:ABC-type transport system substrate-binding protein
VPSNYDRREFLGKGLKTGAAFTLLGGGASVLLDACGSSKSSGPQTTTTLAKKNVLQLGVNPPPKSAKLGGVLTMGVEAEEAGMDPTVAHFDSTGVLYARLVYDPLAMVTFDGTVVPYLAQSITPTKNYTEWEITVRPGVLFHDGTPCDGAALLFCMQQFQASLLVNFALNYWKPKGVSQTGPNSIQISMTDPWVSFPAWLAGYIGGQVAYMFSPTAYRKSESALNIFPIGTGPFMLKKWEPNNFFECVKNPHYWRKDALGRKLPYLDGFTYRPLIEVVTRRDALETNSIQLLHTDDDQTIIDLQGHADINLLTDAELSVGEPDCSFGMINTKDPLLKDIRLRQALAYSMDQAGYCEGIGKGIIKPTAGPFPKPSPFYSDTGYPEFNLAKAKSLVQQWSSENGGKSPTISYTTTATSTSTVSAAYVQSLFQAAGFTCNVGTVQQSALIDDALQGKYQVFSWRQFANIDPDLNYVFWTRAAGEVNFARNYDPVIDTAMDTARRSSDPATRTAQYQIVAKQFAVDLPYIWAARDIWCVAAQTAVQNWNHSTTPDTGARGLPMLSGIIWPTEIWTTAV